MTKRLDNKNLIKKLLAIFVLFLTTTLFLFWYTVIYAADFEHTVQRNININLDGGSTSSILVRYQVDYKRGTTWSAGQWINKDNTPSGKTFKDKSGNDHTVCAKNSSGKYPTTMIVGNNTQNMCCVGTTPYIFIKEPTRTGYTFDGWDVSGTYIQTSNLPAYYTQADGWYAFEIGAWVGNGRGGGDITIKAKWKVNSYTQTLNWYKYVVSGPYNNASATWSYLGSKNYSANYGTTFSSASHAGDWGSVAGYHYWSRNKDSWTVTGDKCDTDCNHHYVANWYKLEVDKNGGTGGSDSVNMRYGTYINLTAPTRTGYDFSKWTLSYNNSTGGSLSGNRVTMGYNKSYPYQDYTSGATLTAKANWTPHTYTVTYDKNKPSGATSEVAGTTANSTHTYDVSKALTANGYSLSGYVFKGWNTKADGSGDSYNNNKIDI